MSFNSSIDPEELFDAIEDVNLGKIDTLLCLGCDVNTYNGSKFYEGNTFLIYAATLGNLEVVKRLVRAGADVNATSEFGDSALSSAALNSHQEVFNYLEPLTDPRIRTDVKKLMQGS